MGVHFFPGIYNLYKKLPYLNGTSWPNLNRFNQFYFVHSTSLCIHTKTHVL